MVIELVPNNGVSGKIGKYSQGMVENFNFLHTFESSDLSRHYLNRLNLKRRGVESFVFAYKQNGEDLIKLHT